MAQAALLEALRRDVSGETLGAWAAGAARRIRRSRERDSMRRKERELRAERRETSPGAGEAAERMEIVRRVLAAVDGLPEPFRTAVRLRYIEERAPRVIAEELGVPVNTVRSRVRRGMGMLRDRLDESSVLAVLALPDPWPSRGVNPGSPRSALRILRQGAVVMGATGAIAIGATIWLFGRGPDPVGAAVEPQVEREDVAVSRPSEVRRVPALPRGRTAALRETAPRVETTTESRPSTVIRGRILRWTGGPGTGAELRLWTSALLGPNGGDLPPMDEWTAKSDVEGRFVLNAGIVEGCGYQLEVVLPGHAPAAWFLYDLTPGEEHDLGELALERGGAIAGVILRGDGHADWKTDWTIVALAETSDPASGRDDVQLVTHAEPSTGGFRFDHVPRGAVRLMARAPLTTGVAEAELVVETDREHEVELRYRGPDPDSRIVVVSDRPGVPSSLEPRSVRCLRLDTGEATARAIPAGRRTVAFDDLEPGAYAIEIDDPRFLPWRSPSVSPGSLVVPELEGSAAMCFEPWGPDGSPTPVIHRVRVRAAGGQGWSSARFDGAPSEVDGTVRGLVPGDYDVEVHLVDHPSFVLAVRDLRANETRRIEVASRPESHRPEEIGIDSDPGDHGSELPGTREPHEKDQP